MYIVHLLFIMNMNAATNTILDPNFTHSLSTQMTYKYFHVMDPYFFWHIDKPPPRLLHSDCTTPGEGGKEEARWVSIHVHACMYAYKHTFMHTYVHTCIHAYVNTFTCIPAYVCSAPRLQATYVDVVVCCLAWQWDQPCLWWHMLCGDWIELPPITALNAQYGRINRSPYMHRHICMRVCILHKHTYACARTRRCRIHAHTCIHTYIHAYMHAHTCIVHTYIHA